jgi:hypothetical protein
MKSIAGRLSRRLLLPERDNQPGITVHLISITVRRSC